MRRCAFLTMEDMRGFFSYDHLAVEPLANLGWSVDFVPWSHPGVHWGDFQVVVIRSTWDYQNRPQEFWQTLQKIESSGALLLNPAAVCQWNLDKRYLKELADRGCPTLPTLWCDSVQPGDGRDWANQLQSDRLVLKPTVGANADHAFVLPNPDSPEWNVIHEVYRDRPGMVQPFVDSIQSVGEYSLFYFADEYSHAINKRPKLGDFRVQEEHGGVITTIEPTPELLATGSQILRELPANLLYARIDLVDWQGSLKLMEVELIEPSLYFANDPASPTRFARALDRLAQSPRLAAN